MDNSTITLPVVGHMQQQPDGSYAMVDAEYVDAPVDTVARFLLSAFGVVQEREGNAD